MTDRTEQYISESMAVVEDLLDRVSPPEPQPEVEQRHWVTEIRERVPLVRNPTTRSLRHVRGIERAAYALVDIIESRSLTDRRADLAHEIVELVQNGVTPVMTEGPSARADIVLTDARTTVVTGWH